jgi:NADPH:quinone reductase-like Zn-dependent oxidoreductase
MICHQFRGDKEGRPMRAIRVHEFGEDPQVDEIDPPNSPARGELLVEVTAVGVGAWDLHVAEGRLAGILPSGDRPFTMGAELCGRVRAVGVGVEGFAVGDRIMANPGIIGAWADRVLVRASSCGRAPRSASDAEAAATPVRGLTAFQALERLHPPAGSTLLIIGAGGAVGRAAVEMALGRRVHVIAVAGGEELEPLLELGAEVAVDYRTEWKSRLEAAAPDGVETALDLVGGESLALGLDLVRDGGRVATTISGADATEAPRDISIGLIAMRSTTSALGAIADRIDAGDLSTRVLRTYPFEEVAVALDALRTRDRAPGQIVLSGRNG